MIPVPVEAEVHTEPHFKNPVNNKLEPRGPEHGDIFILLYTRSETCILLHKLGHIDSDMHTTVGLSPLIVVKPNQMVNLKALRADRETTDAIQDVTDDFKTLQRMPKGSKRLMVFWLICQ